MGSTRVRSYPTAGARDEEALQLDLARQAAAGWRPLGAEWRDGRLRVTYERTSTDDGPSRRGMPWRPLILGTLVVALVLVTGSVLVSRRLPSVGAAPPPSSEPAVVSCEPASAHLVAALQAAMTDPVAGDLRDVSVVRSRAFARLYFVAATISGSGWRAKVGLWATDDPSGEARIYSVNENARAHSIWPDGGTAEWHVSELDDGADVALACGDG